MHMRNRIAFINSNGRLGTIGADGKGVRLLSRADRLYQFPAWSPDSRRIAAIGNNEQGAGVFTFADDPYGEQLALYQSESEAPFYLYWSPDGEIVTFIAGHPEHGIGLHAVRATAQARPRLLASGQPCFWCWAPDATELMCHVGLPADGTLSILDRSGAARGEWERPGLFQSPGYSCDGQYVAYAAARANELSALVVCRRDGSHRMRLPHLGVIALNWSPVEARLAFITPGRNRGHFYGPLRLLEAGGSVQEAVDETVVAFFWSPNGRYLAYFVPEQLVTDAELEEPNEVEYINGSQPPRMTRPSGPSPLMRLQLWVIDVSNGERRRLLTFQPTALFLNQFLPFFDQYALSHNLWSPTSDALVIPVGNEFGDSSLWIAPIDGSDPLRLGAALVGFWSPS
jgi:TolB protein